MKQSLTILGATGSIGASTLKVVRAQPDKFFIDTLTAHSNWQQLAKLAIEFNARAVAIGDETHTPALKDALAQTDIHVLSGQTGLLEAATRPVNRTMAAIVGMAGLKPVLEAAKQGNILMLANKESLICGGDLLMKEIEQHGTTLLPVDSEHNALFQIYDSAHPHDISKLTITASGGPFRDWDKSKIAAATPKQAVAHPNWSMGAKISVDSATLMNKGLELIEAAQLFPHTKRLEAVVHPQSIVHGLVSYVDGTTKAVLGLPDMQSPIAACMGWPERLHINLPELNLSNIGKLTFKPVDTNRFPCFNLATNALHSGHAARITLNSANEAAVEAFLTGKINFYGIAAHVETQLTRFANAHIHTMEDVFALDHEVRTQSVAAQAA